MDFDSFLREADLFGGINWRKYRRRCARRQVKSRMEELGITALDDYLVRLGSDPEELANLPDLMRITVSRFFREKECWQILANTVIPALLAGVIDTVPFRIWSVGCCGGEEPYSVAMVWLENIAPSNPKRTIEIVASDIDQASLERARNGCYDAGALREVPLTTKERFFIRENGVWKIDAQVRELVRFESRNMMGDPLPIGVDLILCRYLAFTYYEGERLLTATTRLRNALRPGGVLMIGRKERLPEGVSRMFEPLQGCTGFYRKV